MTRINSEIELTKYVKAGYGFIYNDFSHSGPSVKSNILHKASCSWMQNINIRTPKYFFESLDEATEWLTVKRGQEGIYWRRCKTCLPLD